MPRALLAIALLSGCASAPTAHERLLDVGRSYGQLTRVNAAAHWAPLLCRLPAPPTLISRSVDPATHGRKLYHLFVRHERAYVRREAGPDDQVLVKEAWEPAPAASKEEEGVAIVDGRPFSPVGRRSSS